MIPTWKLTDHWDQDAHEEEKLQSHKSEHAECFLVDNFLLGLKIPAKLQALIKFVSEEPLGSASQQIKVLLNPQLTRVIKYQHEGNHKWELFPEECKLSTSSRQKNRVDNWELIIPTWKLTNLNRQVDDTDQEEMPNYDSIFLVGSLEMKFPSRTQA